MTELTGAMQDLTAAGIVPLAMLLLVGLVLWVAGRRVLRPAFATAGGIAGGAAAWMLAMSVDLGLNPWMVTAIGALILACIGALVYRFAVAAVLMAVCALAGPSTVMVAHEFRDGNAPGTPGALATPTITADATPGKDTGPTLDAASAWLFGDQDKEGDGSSAASGPAPPSLQESVLTHQLGLSDEATEVIHTARGRAEEFVVAVTDWWSRVPQQLRPLIIGAALTGALLGLLCGTLAPNGSAALVTSCGGSLLWLGSLRVLLGQLGEPVEQFLPATATSGLAVWLAVSMLGMAIQWTKRPKPADTPG